MSEADGDASRRLPYGDGTYRRCIVLTGDATRAVADLEDDFHRFRVEVEHDGAVVSAVRGEAMRFPWTTCPGALGPLQSFAGARLSTRLTAAARDVDPRMNCTHLFDLASLAITHAAARRGRRQYDIAVSDRVHDCYRATLDRDGERVLAWHLHDTEIEQPPPFGGRALRGRGFLDWSESQLDPDTAEAAILLRRSIFIATGRAGNLDEFPDASGVMVWLKNACHSFTPGIAENGLRTQESARDFSHRPDALLADLRA